MEFDTYLSIFRLFKEIITNIIKHSNASEVDIEVVFTDNNFSIIIRDNGIVSQMPTPKDTEYEI